jgi:hypothetical protein
MLLFMTGIVWLVYQAYSFTLFRTQYLSGWSLLLAIVFLAAYNVRKKLPFLPLAASSTWLQFHIYVGWFTFFLFFFHIDFRMPNGILESMLAWLYLFVAVSGVVGLWISRLYPPRISRHERAYIAGQESENRKFGEEVIFERIPIYIRRVRDEAEELVVRSGEESKSDSISDFYIDRLHAYFARPRNFWLHNLESNRPLNTLLGEAAVLQRYLSEKERAILSELTELIRVKDQLDYQYALQAVLKRWFFIHIPLTYGLLLLALFHVVIVYAFSGGNP